MRNTISIEDAPTANMGHPLSEGLYQALLLADRNRTTLPDASLQSQVAEVLEGYQDAMEAQGALHPFRLAAQKHTLVSEGTLEVDDNAVVSAGENANAAYVQAWLWVDLDDAQPADDTALLPEAEVQLGHRQNHEVYNVLRTLLARNDVPDALRAAITPACTAFAEAVTRQTTLNAHREAGDDYTLLDEGTLELDDGATVSLSDGGAYVQTWLWVELDD